MIPSRLPPSSGVGQPTIGRPFYGQAKGQLRLTCTFYAECAHEGSEGSEGSKGSKGSKGSEGGSGGSAADFKRGAAGAAGWVEGLLASPCGR